MKKLLALVLVIACVLSCGFAEEAERIELMTFGGVPVYLDTVQEYTALLFENGYAESDEDYITGLEYVLRYVVGIDLLVPDPIAVIGEDAYAALVTEAGEYYDSVIDSYVDYFAADDATEDDRAALALEAVEYYQITREEYTSNQPMNEAKNAAYNALLETLEVSVTDEEIAAHYLEMVEYEMQIIDSVQMYEMYTQYGYNLDFYPEGFRGILHILLLADSELCDAYKNAATDEEKAAAIENMIASKQDTINEIYAAIEAGTAFTDLIAQYNEDPGMNDPDNLANGYAVHPESGMWVPEFTAGSFSDKMVQPGDVSDPVCTSYGIHILYFLREIPSGPIPMSDEVAASLRAEIEEEQRYEKADELLMAFEVTYTDAYAEYIGTPNFLDK